MEDHNAVVYTPCHTTEGRLHTYNFTLPQGMICTDVLPRPGNSLAYISPACSKPVLPGVRCPVMTILTAFVSCLHQ